MNIALLSGAYGNAGDSLIEQRAKELLQTIIPGVHVSVFSRRDLEFKFDQINANDVVAFSGGPIYQYDISGNFNLECALKITRPLKIIGGGCKFTGRNSNLPYTSKFSKSTYELFKRINDSNGMACRDWSTVYMLKNQGFCRAVMTGCPAWYDLNMIHESKLNGGERIGIMDSRIIAVSDPAFPQNMEQALSVIEFIHSVFPKTVIKYVLHRGRATNNYDYICNRIHKQGIAEIVDLFPDYKSFSIYDLCDLHIGYRVHAHIYNLSKRHRSILIEEDGRGAGVNEALGIPSLVAYNNDTDISNMVAGRVLNRLLPRTNRFILNELEAYIRLMENLGDDYYSNAYRLMGAYYEKMKDYLMGWMK